MSKTTDRSAFVTGAIKALEIAGPALTAVLAILALIGWLGGEIALASLGTNNIPMAPSTAVLFILTAGVVLAGVGKPSRRSDSGLTEGIRVKAATGVFVILVSATLLILSSSGLNLDIEHAGISVDRETAGAPQGHMSPVTAACFLLSSVAYLSIYIAPDLLKSRAGGPNQTVIMTGTVSAVAVFFASIVLTTGYLLGGPLLYGSRLIPPALTTSVAFFGVSGALVRKSIPELRKAASSDRATSLRRLPYSLIGVFLISAAGIVAIAYHSFVTYRESHRREVENELSAVADLKVHELVQWKRERLGDAGVFFYNESFLNLARTYLRNSSDARTRARLENWLDTVESAYGYREILFYDRYGIMHLPVEGPEHEIPADIMPQLGDAIQKGTIGFLDFYRSGDENQVFLGVLVPVYEAGDDPESSPENLTNAGDSATGVLALIIDPETYLYPLIRSWPTGRRTAESFLVRREEKTLIYLNDLKYDEDAALRLTVPVSRHDLPEVKAAGGIDGIVSGTDYRGEKVAAAVRSIADSPWYLVAKIDIEEINEPLRERLWWMIGLVAILLGSSAFVAAAIWQRNEKLHYRAISDTRSELSRSEKRFRTILFSIGDGVIATDVESRVELLNPVAEQLTGWSVEEACGRPLSEVFHIVNEETRAEVENPAERALKEGTIVGLANHTMLISADGTERPVTDSAAPIRNESGEINGAALVFRDQTEERKTQREILEEREKYQNLYNSIRDAILVVDTERRIVDCNPAFTEMFGYSLDEIAGEKTDVIYNDRKAFEEMGMSIRETAASSIFIRAVEYRKKNGEVFPGETNVFYLKNFDDEIEGFIGLIRDISIRREAEKARDKLQEQLLQSQKMESVGRLAGGIAHDFNNMLSVILGHTELARSEVEPESRLYNHIEQIGKAATRSADLTRQLLGFARKQTIAPKLLDLNETVAGMLDMIRRLIGEDIRLSWIPNPEPQNVKIDPSQINQILANLMVNARDAIEGSGNVVVEIDREMFDREYCERHPGFRPGTYALLAVSDDGSGMEKEVLSHIYEPFYTTKPVGKGTGLGMATVYGIVKQNNGFINVYSEPGEGTTVKIYLPIVEAAATEIAGGEAFEEEMTGHGETILVVEDEEPVLGMIRELLELAGHRVLVAGSAKEALGLLDTYDGPVPLVITDVVMPDTSGNELAELIKERYPDTAILFMSGYTPNVIASRGLLDRDADLIRKPFSRRELSDKVRELLDRRRQP